MMLGQCERVSVVRIAGGSHKLTDLMLWLAQTHDAASPLMATIARSNPAVLDRDRYVLGAIAVSRELAQGVLAEAAAGRAGNAMRLARHLFEQELEFGYILDEPSPRLCQWRASEAKIRLRLSKLPGLQLDRDLQKQLRALTRWAQRKEERADDRQKRFNESVPFSDRGYLPNRRILAEAQGRAADYHLFYAGASWLSHPGNIASEMHFEEGGMALKSPGPSESDHIAQGVALAVDALYRLVDRANWVLGPLPYMATNLAAISTEVDLAAAHGRRSRSRS